MGPAGEIGTMPWVDRNSQPHAVMAAGGSRDPKLDWYTGAVQSGRLHVSEPLFDRTASKAPLVSVTKPFFDKEGRTLGVGGADLSLEIIHAITCQLAFGPGESQG